MPPQRTLLDGLHEHKTASIVPAWRCPFCFGKSPAVHVYLPLPELKEHLLSVHGMHWEDYTGAGWERLAKRRRRERPV